MDSFAGPGLPRPDAREADRLAAALGLQPHPEGGLFRETWRAAAEPGERPSGTAIHYLLRAGERSHWHRVDADEIWLFHAGAPLVLGTAPSLGGPAGEALLGGDVLHGEHPQVVVPAGTWQTARTIGAWTLVSCTVSPGFRFEGFELAPAGTEIPPL